MQSLPFNRKKKEEPAETLQEGTAESSGERTVHVPNAAEVKKIRQEFRSGFAKVHQDISLDTVAKSVADITKQEEKNTDFPKEYKLLKDSRKEAERISWKFFLEEDPDEWYRHIGTTGTISGVVLDENDKPITDAIVHLEHPDARGRAVSGFGAPHRHHNGEFTFLDVPPGRYVLVARKNVAGHTIYGVQDPEGEVVIDPSNPNRKVAAVRMRFYQTTYVKGVALDADGRPVKRGEAHITLIHPASGAVLQNTEGQACTAKAGENGEFSIPHVPLSTLEAQYPFIVAGHSALYGLGQQEKPSTAGTPDVLRLAPTRRGIEGVVVKFIGTEELQAHFLEPQQGAEVKEAVNTHIVVTGAHIKAKNRLLLLIKGVIRGESELPNTQSVWLHIGLPRVRERVEVKLIVADDRNHSLGQVTFYAIPDLLLPSGSPPREERSEELQDAIIIEEQDEHGHKKGKTHVIHISHDKLLPPGRGEASVEERAEPASPLPVIDRERALRAIDSYAQEWSRRAENRNWAEDAGSIQDFKQAIYSELPVIFAARDVTKNVLPPAQVPAALRSIGLDEQTLLALWRQTDIARRRNLREFLVRWFADHREAHNQYGLAIAEQMMISDYWNRNTWDPDGVNRDYKDETANRIASNDFLKIAYRAILRVGPGDVPVAAIPSDTIIDMIKAELRAAGATEDDLQALSWPELVEVRNEFLRRSGR